MRRGPELKAFVVLPEGCPDPAGVRVVARLDRFDLAVPLAGRLDVQVLVLSQRLVDCEDGWGAVRALLAGANSPQLWVVADGDAGAGQAWRDLAARVIADGPATEPGAGSAPAAGPRGGTWLAVILGAKGGVGKTFLAGNLGAYLARRGSPVDLVDLDFASGDLALRLGVETVIDLQAAGGGDRPVADGQLVPNLPLAVWAAPPRPELSCLADEGLVGDILASAAGRGHGVIVDTPAEQDSELTYSTLERADRAVLVTTLTPGALRQARVLLDLLKRLNFPVRERLCAVLNRVRRRSLVSPAAAAELVGCEFQAVIPDVPELAAAEAYYGRPAVLGRSPAALAKAIGLVAGIVLPAPAAQAPARRRRLPWARGRVSRELVPERIKARWF